MADEQYRWLDRETAERLLGGEPLEAVDAAARAQVEQLAETLGALSAPPPPTSEELPGEAAALAAFRKVRAERATTLASAGTPAAGPVRDAGVVRLGRRAGRDRRRWGRPARVGLAAVLAAGMLGGVAVAAGTGVFPSPFRTDEPEPAASVSATGTNDPLITPSPDGPGRGDGTDGGSPDGDGTGRDGVDGEDASSKEQDLAAERAERLASACRDTRDGKELGAALRRDLEDAAGGASRVREYCEGVLSGPSGGGDGAAEGEEQGGTGPDNGTGPGSGSGTGPGSGSGSGAGSGPGSGEAGQGGDTDHDPEDSGDAGDPAGTGGRPGRGDQGGRSGATDESGAAGGKGRRTDDAAARAAGPAAPAS